MGKTVIKSSKGAESFDTSNSNSGIEICQPFLALSIIFNVSGVYACFVK